MSKTKPLALLPAFETGNTKAAASQAGATSADLWMTPYDQIRYDPADNVRPVDEAWVKELTALMIQHGYDKGSPLHCYVRKEGDRDLFYVYKGQHRYLAAGAAIKAGKDLGKIPLVVRAANEVDRAKMVVDGHHSNRQKAASPLDLAAAIAELRDVHQYDQKQICIELGVTDQTIRDIALLEQAPTALHDLVRAGSVAGTLAIEEIRAHGGDKALERIVAGLSKAKEAGKNKVTKKHLNAQPEARATPAALKITDASAKRLLQALQSVLHDPVFGQLSPGTIHGVHAALAGLEDMLDLPAKATRHPIHAPNKHGVFDQCETISSPRVKTTGQPPAEIHLAHVDEQSWIHSFSLSLGSSYMGALPSMRSFTATFPTRGQAIRAAVSDITRALESSASTSKAKGADVVRRWLDKLYLMPDPDWTPELAAKLAAEKEVS
ncbi:ParB/RepB/Spo0J family partition protein [Burkholderia gladioli]|uniref:ParB/RepB/Spo0J family partition protein n=1 Tax=Burkholderia gladioli TaxID=28095 RepID=UPI001640FD2B|nr:pyridoxal phosphate biosynthetic protein PdxJ [Burkholderia gladioli]